MSDQAFAVSYYVPDERYWQFSGEWFSLFAAENRAKLIFEETGRKVRIRQGDKIVREY